MRRTSLERSVRFAGYGVLGLVAAAVLFNVYRARASGPGETVASEREAAASPRDLVDRTADTVALAVGAFELRARLFDSRTGWRVPTWHAAWSTWKSGGRPTTLLGRRTPPGSIRREPPGTARSTLTSTRQSVCSSDRSVRGHEGLALGSRRARLPGARRRAGNGAAAKDGSHPSLVEPRDSESRGRRPRTAKLPRLPAPRARLGRPARPRCGRRRDEQHRRLHGRSAVPRRG